MYKVYKTSLPKLKKNNNKKTLNPFEWKEIFITFGVSKQIRKKYLNKSRIYKRSNFSYTLQKSKFAELYK